MTLSGWLEKQWAGTGWWQLVLWPVSQLFRLLSLLRRAAYRAGLLRSRRLPVPVIVVGNVSVGGTGKTPLVQWLAGFLKQNGLTPGVLSRGYGGSEQGPVCVPPSGDAQRYGDEPVLLATTLASPVWIGRDRFSVGAALLAAHPECNVLISDDGLQHYALQRDVELVVVDAERGFGNARLLPAGPLREGLWRLRDVDAVVINGGSSVNGVNPDVTQGAHTMQLKGVQIRNLTTGECKDVGALFGKKVHAVAGIGHPQRFFAHLSGLGLSFTPHPFPDHHVFETDDLAWPAADAILMTEKDAVKCNGFADARYWALPVQAHLPPNLGRLILERLRKINGRQTA